MKDLFIKLLWYLEGKADFEGITLYKNGSYASIDLEYQGVRMSLTLREKDEEDK